MTVWQVLTLDEGTDVPAHVSVKPEGDETIEDAAIRTFEQERLLMGATSVNVVKLYRDGKLQARTERRFVRP